MACEEADWFWVDEAPAEDLSLQTVEQVSDPELPRQIGEAPTRSIGGSDREASDDEGRQKGDIWAEGSKERINELLKLVKGLLKA